ncbi:MAG: class I SAM-dependent methyltransferase [Actinobacteria bacterium]|nr:class I SAM-dependent methyltransferase [Actinomycetota bacterium]
MTAGEAVPPRSARPTADRDARAANQHSYGDGAQVRAYLTDPYHQVRRDLAVRLLLRGLRSGAPPLAGPVLEIGVGSSTMVAGVSDLGYRAIMADLAVEALRGVAPPPARAVCLDAARPLPFADGSLAAVVMGDLIEHVYDPFRLVCECHRVLQIGGILVITTPNLATVQDRLRFMVGRAPRQVDPLHPYLWLHIRPFTPSLLARLLHRARFQAVEVRANFVTWRLPGGRWVRSRMLARVAPGLGGSLVVSARKPNTDGRVRIVGGH